MRNAGHLDNIKDGFLKALNARGREQQGSLEPTKVRHRLDVLEQSLCEILIERKIKAGHTGRGRDGWSQRQGCL